MKTISKLFLLVLWAALLGSCDEPSKTAFVYGEISMAPGGKALFHGSLSSSGSASVYGSCEYKNGKFNFTVGQADEKTIESIPEDQSPTYLSISGIEGPDGSPTEGVFVIEEGGNKPTPKANESYYGSMSRIVAKNDKDGWTFEANDSCVVQLFATPKAGEVIFNEEDLNKTFDYYVRLSCTGGNFEGDDGTPLSTIYAELYFENCS